MSLRTYAIPLALVSLGIGLGVVSDQPPETPSFEAPVADVSSVTPEQPVPEEAVPVAAELASDPQAAAPEPAMQAAAPESMEAPQPVYEQSVEPIPITDAYGESIPVDAADVPSADEVPIADLPDGILPNGVVEGQPYPPSEGEAPYQVVTTNPMACVPEGAPGCSSGAYCCSELVCVQDVCVQSN